MADRPDYRDYGANPNGDVDDPETWSADAFEAMLNENNGTRASVYCEGDFVIERHIGTQRMCSFEGPAASAAGMGFSILIPKKEGLDPGIGSDYYWMTLGVGYGLFNLRFAQPQQTNENITGTYPNLVGAPDFYPDVIKTEHHMTALGVPLAQGSSIGAGRGTLRNIFADGVYNFGRARDDDTIEQKSVAGLDWSGIRGYAINDMLVLGQVSGLSRVLDVITSPAYFAAAGRALDPEQKYFNWRRQNGTNLWLTNKCVGLTAWMAVRGGLHGVRVSGGYRGEEEELDYRGLRSGRVNGFNIYMGCEQTANWLTFENDAYANGGKFIFEGHPVDDADHASAPPAIRINTDRTVAGNLSKKGEDPDLPVSEENPRAWRPMTLHAEWSFDLELRGQEASNALIFVAATDGHGDINVILDAARFSQGDVAVPAILMEEGATSRLVFRGGRIVATRASGQVAFEVPEPIHKHIRFDGTTFLGVIPTLQDVDFSDTRIFSPSCQWLQRHAAVDPDEDATGEGDD